jgi:kinesin family protein 5
MVLLTRGEKNRVKRATKMNIQSSRSHSLFQLLIETDQVDSKGMLKRSKLNLGDLAGSEKINKDEEMQAKHMLELRNINLSLTTLGKVIQQLSHFSHSKDPS